MTRNWDLLDLWWCRGGRTDDIDRTEENWRKMRRWHLRRVKRRARIEKARWARLNPGRVQDPQCWAKFQRSSFRIARALTAYERIAGKRAVTRVMRRFWGKTISTAKPSQQNLDL